MLDYSLLVDTLDGITGRKNVPCALRLLHMQEKLKDMSGAVIENGL
jgi:hypothetical protein